jgi:hypothetical protein
MQTKLTAPQAKQLARIQRGIGTHVAIQRGVVLGALNQRLLMRKLIWYTIQTSLSQRVYGGDGSTTRYRVLRLTAKGKRALNAYRGWTSGAPA